MQRYRAIRYAIKWSLAAFAGLLLLISAWLAEQRIAGDRRLSRYLESIRAQGGKTDVKDLVPPHRPDPAQNAMVSLLSLSNQMSLVDSWRNTFPPSGRVVAPGRLVVAHRLSRWFPGATDTNTWDQLGPKLDEQADLIEGIQRALQKPGFDLDFDYTGGFQKLAYGSITVHHREFNLMDAVSLYHLHRGQLGAAHRQLMAMMRMIKGLETDRLIIVQMTRQADAHIAFNAVWAALLEPGWNETQLAELQRVWSSIDLVGDLSKAFEMERAMQLSVDQELPRFSHNLDTTDVQEAGAAILAAELRPLQPWCWKHVWKGQDILQSMQQLDGLIEENRVARDKGWSASLQSKPADGDDSSDESEIAAVWKWFRFPNSSQPSFLTDDVIRNGLFVQTQQQMLCAALACHRYRLAAGHWPESLEQLVPQYIVAIPRDFLGGGQLIYRLDKQRGFILYSKGDNGLDDGADPAAGKDVVWPTPATSREADEVLLKEAAARF